MRPIAVNMTEAARLAGVSRPTLYRWARMDGFPVIRLGGCTRVIVADFEAWLRKNGGHSNA